MFFPHKMQGVPWNAYRYAPENWVPYTGTPSPNVSCDVLFSTSHESSGNDSTLTGQAKVEVTYDVCFFNRNQATISVPTLQRKPLPVVPSTKSYVSSSVSSSSKDEQDVDFDYLEQEKSSLLKANTNSCSTV